MARPTEDRKPNNLIVRVNDEIKERLKDIADTKGVTVSEYIRSVVNSALHNSDNVMQNNNSVMQNNSELSTEKMSDLPFDVEIELKDTLRMVELSSSKEEVPLFLKDLHDRLESGELQIENGKLKLGYSEVFEVLNRAETKKWLKGVWNMCEEKGLDYKTGLRSVFEMGSKAVISGMGSQQEVNYIP